jgi:tetratricopeptide (TPR) repeat protein
MSDYDPGVTNIPKTAPGASIGSVGSDLLGHLFGDDGVAALRAHKWRFISAVAPLFGFFADILSVFGKAVPTLFLWSAAIAVFLILPIALRAKYCRHCAVPCVLAFILAIAFGFVAATQKVFAAEDGGVAAKFIPGIPEIQSTLAEMLGLQKTTLKAVANVQSDTTEIKRQLAETKKELASVSAQLEANSALVRQLLERTPGPQAPGAKAAVREAVTAIEKGAAADPRYAKALELLKAGNPAEAEPLLKAVAQDKERSASTNSNDAKEAAAAYRNLAAIASVSEPGRARGYYAKAAQLDPSDIEGMFQNGWFQKEAGQLDAAQSAYSRVVEVAKPGVNDHMLIWSKLGLGDIQQQRGNLPAALTSYQAAEAIADRLAKTDPGNADWRRDLSVSYNKVGNVQVAQGNIQAALTSYQAAKTIAESLVKSDPNNAIWQRDLLVSYTKVGEVQEEQGNLPAALKSYHAGLAIAERNAKSDPANPGWQRDLSVLYNKVGNVQVAQGNLPDALTSYQADLAIADRLAKSDPNNAAWQRDLLVSYTKVGRVQEEQGNLPAALKSYQASLAIAERNAKSDPGNAGWQRDLSFSHSRIGGLQMTQGNHAAALASYQSVLAISERLAKSDVSNAGWQRDLSISYGKIGEVQMARGDKPAALASYQAAKVIVVRLIDQFPDQAQWKNDAIWYDQRIAVLQKK